MSYFLSCYQNCYPVQPSSYAESLPPCWLLAVLPGLAASLFDAPSNGIFYSMPIFCLPEFLIGSCTYLAIHLGWRYRLGTAPQVTALVLFLLSLGTAGPKMPLYIGHNWITLPFMAFMIFSLSNNQGPIAAVLAHRIFRWLGRYCFYSFQVLVLLLLIRYHDQWLQTVPALSNHKELAIVSLTVLLALSASGYYCIEEPARCWIRQRYRERLSTPSVADLLSTPVHHGAHLCLPCSRIARTSPQQEQNKRLVPSPNRSRFTANILVPNVGEHRTAIQCSDYPM